MNSKKCPMCGALMNAWSTRCMTCGESLLEPSHTDHEFENRAISGAYRLANICAVILFILSAVAVLLWGVGLSELLDGSSVMQQTTARLYMVLIPLAGIAWLASAILFLRKSSAAAWFALIPLYVTLLIHLGQIPKFNLPLTILILGMIILCHRARTALLNIQPLVNAQARI